jgi:hypothetical protein
VNSECFRLGFERSVLDRTAPDGGVYEVTHIGGYGAYHRERTELLETIIARGIPLMCWGYGIDAVPADSAVRRSYQGEAWGLEMYRIRRKSRIAISKHIDTAAGDHANIMAMYEATGAGALLVIDHKSDLSSIFEPGKEVISYRSADECTDMISYYLAHEAERQAIARAGQDRTLGQHTYFQRMQELVGILGRYV